MTVDEISAGLQRYKGEEKAVVEDCGRRIEMFSLI